jgi:hypothetical protein
VLRGKACGRHGFHKCSVVRLLVAETLEVEPLLDQHAVELVPCNQTLRVAISLLKQPIQTLVDLLPAELELALPGLEVAQSLGDELVEGELVVILLEGILEET